MKQRCSNKKHINMWYQIASCAISQRAKDFHRRRTTLHHLQDDVANSKKEY